MGMSRAPQATSTPTCRDPPQPGTTTTREAGAGRVTMCDMLVHHKAGKVLWCQDPEGVVAQLLAPCNGH